jgi:hypothetical protein
MTRNRSLAGDDRSVSEVVGYVLVISLVITTVGVVSVSGVSVLQDAREAEQIENAKRAFDLLADNMGDIYREGAPSRSTEIQLGSAQLVAQETTRFNVSWYNGSDRERASPLYTNSVIYRGGGDRRLVYDSGAVFSLSGPNGSGAVLREPPFVTTTDRVLLTFPQVRSQGTTAVSGSTALVRATTQPQDRRLLERNTTYDDIWVNVTSTHWRAWQTALSSRQQVACPITDPGNSTVHCQLLPTGDPDDPSIPGGSPDVFSLAKTKISVSLTR